MPRRVCLRAVADIAAECEVSSARERVVSGCRAHIREDEFKGTCAALKLGGCCGISV